MLAANPLDDIENLWKLDGVLIDGRWVSRAYLLDQLDQTGKLDQKVKK